MIAVSATRKLVVVLLIASVSTSAQSQRDRPPRFEDYRVKEIYSGTPAAPKILTPVQRSYRTRIREGVSKGWGVFRDGKEQPGPNFAGHYIIVQWACGSPCGMMAIVDAPTGKVYNPPISEGFLLPPLPAAVPGDPDQFVPWVAGVEFRQNSNLMIVRANPDPSKSSTNYTYYFLWEDNQWKLLRRIPMVPNER